MNLYIKLVLFPIILILYFDAAAQSDSTTLSYSEYVGNIISYHPIARKADLKLASALAETLGAKGQMDPTFAAGWNQKSFDDKLYYRHYQAKFKFPTPLGIDVVGGYENTDGVFLNPENKTDDFGLWHLGVEMDVLQGFLFNERKAALKQAEVFQELAENERMIILNNLIYDASSAYLYWQQFHYNKKILEENTSIAKTYLENTKQAFFGGEKSMMDTLEAFIVYQDAIATLQSNELGLIKVKQQVENHLWFDGMAMELRETTRPEDYNNSFLGNLNYLNDMDLSTHPIISASINKMSLLEIDQRLKREKLKPKLKVKYNPLLATSENSVAPTYSIDNYKWGLDFSMPLLLRSERADMRKIKIKIQEKGMEVENKKNELKNKIEASWLQYQQLQKQLVLLRQNVVRYERLLEGENEKFKFGESSVFLLNKRQEKYIDGQLKLLATHIKKQGELLKFLYFSNQLVSE